ncbi:hypothetical protein OESDEN_19202 [Oesophagostomum dentatum]|uniref:Protein UNC80 C-terminal domain-containing protein n=1 Tax=Oesophagostomum dentatum TaxID=61180 RepID=A0A0B1SC72_OESDE|nr:hypothetical protein OESDEN_19202 [Oesophagostomum dentatum]
MYHGDMGEQLKAMEAVHKFTWANLMSDMFEKMENAFMFADLHLFINVVSRNPVFKKFVTFSGIS